MLNNTTQIHKPVSERKTGRGNIKRKGHLAQLHQSMRRISINLSSGHDGLFSGCLVQLHSAHKNRKWQPSIICSLIRNHSYNEDISSGQKRAETHLDWETAKRSKENI